MASTPEAKVKARKREPRSELPCAECGSGFMPTKAQWDKRSWGRVFCGRECLAVGMRKSSNVWWDANPLTNTVTRPTRPCAVCGADFAISEKQHYNIRKNPEAKVYCTRECYQTTRRHDETRANAIAWMRTHPEVGGQSAARALNIGYMTLYNWRKAEGLVPYREIARRSFQTCAHCGEEYWPSSAQWHQRNKQNYQVCSEKCRRDAQSARTLGVPVHKLRKHGLYSLEVEQAKQLRKAIYKFINNGANQ
jgi:hypothetical protein